MTERQTQIAIKVLQYLSDHSNFERDYNVQVFACGGDNEELLDDYLHVKGSLEKDYHLIRTEKAELHLTPDGEAAQRIGFEKYLRKVKKGTQLDITLKRLDVLSKLATIFKDSKTLLIIAVGLIDYLLGVITQQVFPIVRTIATWLIQLKDTLLATQ